MNVFKPIPSDISQYRLSDLFKLTVAVAIAVVSYPILRAFSICIVVFLCGYGFMMLADSIDKRNVHKRGPASKSLCALGALMLVISASVGLALFGCFLFWKILAGFEGIFMQIAM